MLLEEKVARQLTSQKKTIAVAESCTGGLLTHRLTNIPGSSRYLKFGIIAYSDEAKIKLLKVPNKLIKQYGAVSGPVASAMAEHVRKLWVSNFGVSITGIAGPTGGTRFKPVGLTFIAVSSKIKNITLKSIFTGNRATVKSKATTKALKMILEFLS